MKIARALIPVIIVIILCAVTGAFGMLFNPKIDITDVRKGTPLHWHIFQGSAPSHETGFPNLFTGEKVFGLHNGKRICGDSSDCRWFTHDLTTDRIKFWSKNTYGSERLDGLHMKPAVGENVYLKGHSLPHGYKTMREKPYACKGQCPRGFEWTDFEKVCLLDDGLLLKDSRQRENEKYPLCSSFN